MRRISMLPVVIVAACCLFAAVNVGADPTVLPAGNYRLAVRLLLPELEETRDITVRDERCLATDEVAGLFPVLAREALQGCRLAHPRHGPKGTDYDLVCASAQVATGSARVRSADDGVLFGLLVVKMGGRQLDFSQHTVAQRTGGCASGGAH